MEKPGRFPVFDLLRLLGAARGLALGSLRLPRAFRGLLFGALRTFGALRALAPRSLPLGLLRAAGRLSLLLEVRLPLSAEPPSGRARTMGRFRSSGCRLFGWDLRALPRVRFRFSPCCGSLAGVSGRPESVRQPPCVRRPCIGCRLSFARARPRFSACDRLGNGRTDLLFLPCRSAPPLALGPWRFDPKRRQPPLLPCPGLGNLDTEVGN